MVSKERTDFTTGILNSGTSIGAVVAPISPWIIGIYGWQEAFLITQGLSFLSG